MAEATVRDIMDAEAPSVAPAGRGHSRLPVVAHGRYQGLVTRADVLRALNDGG